MGGVLLHASEIDEMPIILEMALSLLVYDYSDIGATLFFSGRVLLHASDIDEMPIILTEI